MSGITAPALGSQQASGATSTNVTQWGGAATTLGQNDMAHSVPVVIASDQSTIPVQVISGGDVQYTEGTGATSSSVGTALVIKNNANFWTTPTSATPLYTNISDGSNSLVLVKDGDNPSGGYGFLSYGKLNGANAYAIAVNASGFQSHFIMDFAGNNRGVNVNASNQLSVSIDGGSFNSNLTTVSGINTATGTADTQVIAAQGSGLFIYITAISVLNTGSTTSLITIETDTSSAKTAIWYMINPAGGGDNITFPTPLKVPVSNKNLGFVCGSSSSTQYVSISGFTAI